MVMATVGVSGIKGAKSRTMSSLSTEMANIVSQNTATLEAGTKINSARSAASVAGAAQALANQTGGNIMGFTYE